MTGTQPRVELEKTDLHLGFVPLSDCAPLVAAYEKGFFENEGLQVTLCRERSWASIRDKTAFGVYDASQMLYPMPLASTMGVGGPEVTMVTALCLSLGGNAITVSESLHAEMRAAAEGETLTEMNSAAAIAQVIAARQAEGAPALTLGCVFPTSTHHYELRHWLKSAGVDCDLKVKLLVVPPPDMPDAMREGRIDGFCVGEPWNTMSVQRGWGRIVVTKHALWNNGPEKVLGVTRAWAEEHPATHQALLRAIIAAAAWCDEPDNREELSRMIASDRYVDVPLEAVRPSMLGELRFTQDGPPTECPDFMVFHRYAANFPWVSHGRWFLNQMADAGQIDGTDNPVASFDTLAAEVIQPALYRAACADLGLAYPMIDHKPEGVHTEKWSLTQATRPIVMGPDRLLNDQTFAETIRSGSGGPRRAPS
ncbi:MAG: CmpA/NrtA family ABC transporter substrate-binding protein [Planctomycetota bacterium]